MPLKGGILRELNPGINFHHHSFDNLSRFAMILGLACGRMCAGEAGGRQSRGFGRVYSLAIPIYLRCLHSGGPIAADLATL